MGTINTGNYTIGMSELYFNATVAHADCGSLFYLPGAGVLIPLSAPFSGLRLRSMKSDNVHSILIS